MLVVGVFVLAGVLLLFEEELWVLMWGGSGTGAGAVVHVARCAGAERVS